jgi:hypothetical protein
VLGVEEGELDRRQCQLTVESAPVGGGPGGGVRLEHGMSDRAVGHPHHQRGDIAQRPAHAGRVQVDHRHRRTVDQEVIGLHVTVDQRRPVRQAAGLVQSPIECRRRRGHHQPDPTRSPLRPRGRYLVARREIGCIHLVDRRQRFRHQHGLIKVGSLVERLTRHPVGDGRFGEIRDQPGDGRSHPWRQHPGHLVPPTG